MNTIANSLTYVKSSNQTLNFPFSTLNMCCITFFFYLLADLEIEVDTFVNMIFFPRSLESLFIWQVNYPEN